MRTLTVTALLAVTGTPLWAQTTDHLYRSWRWCADVGAARAAGLGGAFIAVADDASAPAHNPAGMARLEKKELAAGVLSRNTGQASTLFRDAIEGATGVGFVGGAGRITRQWAIGGYLVRPYDRRLDLLPRQLPDGSSAVGYLNAQVTDVGGAIAWAPSAKLSLGARITATHLKLVGHELTTGSNRSDLEVGAAAGETRVTGSFGALWEASRGIRVALVAQSGASYLVARVANSGGVSVDPGSEYELRQPSVVSTGVAWVTPRVLVVGQLDYVRYSEVLDQLVITQGSASVGEYDLTDALEPRVGVEVSQPVGSVSVQLRAGLHVQAPGAVAYRGSSPAEAVRFGGAEREALASIGGSVVTGKGFRLDLAGRFGGEQNALWATAGFRW